jgi:hypothetical protein
MELEIKEGWTHEETMRLVRWMVELELNIFSDDDIDAFIELYTLYFGRGPE